jgi:hypothetical protein
MKNHQTLLFKKSALVAIMLFAFASIATAQSGDIDTATPLTSNVIEGEGDGKAETIYYSFTATKGDVKVTVDAKTDDRSTPLTVSLLDEDGKELLPIYVVVKGSGSREVATKRFVRETKVIVKIGTREDKDINLLTYKIKLDGSVKIEETPAVGGEVPTESAPPSSDATTTTEGTTTEAAPKPKAMDKLKKIVKVKDN